MQIKGLFLITFSSVATTATTFHDGSQVPHARVAVEERHYYEGEPAASSFFHPVQHNIQPNSDLPPIMARDPVGILSRNPKYSTDETFRMGEQDGDAKPSAKRARTTEHQEPSRKRARVQASTDEYPSIDRLKARTAKLYFGLKNPEQREEAFVELNKMRQEDGLQPLSFKEFATAAHKKETMHKFRIAISKFEQGKPVDPEMMPYFTHLKKAPP